MSPCLSYCFHTTIVLFLPHHNRCGIGTLDARRANCALDCISKSLASKSRDAIIFLALVRPHLKYCVSSLLPRFQRDVEKPERVQQKATKPFSGLKKERLKELDFFQPREEKAEGSLVTVFKCFNDGLYRRCQYRDAQGKWVAQKKFHLDVKKKFCTMRMSCHWNRFLMVVVESPLLEISKADVSPYLCLDTVLVNVT